MPVLVTGANGFVGSTVARALSASGVETVGLVRTGRRPPPGVSRTSEVEAFTEPALTRAFAGMNAVVHAASVVHRPGASLSEYEQFNTQGTRALVEACKNASVQRLVLLSSIKVYGEAPEGVIDEATEVAPDGPYARTKLAAEKIVLDAASAGTFSACVLRLCPVFGVGDKGNVRTMITAIARRRLVLPAGGHTRKSIVHVSTVADVARAAIDSSLGGVFVVADRTAPSLREVANTIASALGRRSPPSVPSELVEAAAWLAQKGARLLGREIAISPSLIRKSLTPTVCSPARAEQAFGVTCHVDLALAIREEIAWLRRERLL